MLKHLRVIILLIGLTNLCLQGYAQLVFNFTTAGASGRTGPTQAQVNTAYGAGNTLNGKVTIHTQGIQEWVVPFSGPYRIEAAGAQGGNGAGKLGGLGAKIVGEFNLTAGSVIKILVGQTAVSRPGSDVNSSGAGGGGSFIAFIDNTPILVAGGGGGAGAQNGLPGNITLNGGASESSSGAGGIDGGGGGGAQSGTAGTRTTPGGTGMSCSFGAGGGGFFTRGGYNCSGTEVNINGESFVSGGLGGLAQTSRGGVEGGFGGGAGVGHRASGGGGWSGGGGGVTMSGGGGGSYNGGINQVNIVGAQQGNGYIQITQLYNASISETATISCNGQADASLAVTVTGGVAPYTYLWSNGSTNPTLTNIGAGTYSVTAKDQNDLTTTATYTVKDPIGITSQPVATSAAAKAGTSFSVVASGSDLSYQWQSDASGSYQNITNNGIYSGATTSTLTLSNVDYALNGLHYRVLVSRAGCAALISDAPALTVNRLTNTISGISATATNSYGDADFTLSPTSSNSIASFTYNVTSGSAVTVDANGKVHVVGVGTAIVTVSQIADSYYQGATVNQTITVNPLTIAVTAAAKSKTYGESDPALTYTPNPALVSGDSFTGSLTRTEGENAGSYAINQGTLALSNNYTLTYTSANLTIGRKTIVVTAEAKNKIYGDADPTLTYTPNPTLMSGDAFTGALTRAAGEDVGAYAINQGTLALNNNYILTYTSANLSIGKKAIVVTAEAKNKIYGDADPILAYTPNPALKSGDTFTGALTRAAGENVGTYAINQGTLALNSNYTLTYTGADFSIGKKTINVTAAAKNKTYGDADPTLTFTPNPTLITGDAFTGSLTRTTGENVGTYAINQGTLALSSNYTLIYTGANLSIGNKTIIVTAAAKSKIYGDADPTLTFTPSPALVAGDSFTGSLTRVVGENVGTYTITQGSLSANSNYVLAYNSANLTISKKTITVTAAAKNKTYGASDPAFTYTPNPTLVAGDTFTGALTRTSGENVGTYAINQGSLLLNNNYTLVYNGALLSISKKGLTIIADNKEKFVGMANPTLTVSYDGFVNEETNAVLTTQPTVTTSVNIATPIGTYPIQASNAVAANYTISYTDGLFTVKPGAPTSVSLTAITLYENRPAGTIAGNLSSTSDDPNATFSYSLVTGAGSSDNAKFTIVNNELRTSQVLDYEFQRQFDVRVRSTTQHGFSLDQTFVIQLNDVNEVPTLAAVNNQVICYTQLPQEVTLTGITAGPEANQTVALSVVSNNSSLFRSLTVEKNTGTNGTLRYVLATNAVGVATVTIMVKDNGGTANGGVDSYTRSFVITANALPVINITAGKMIISRGDQIQLVATGGTSYSWSNAQGIVGGQNSATLTVRPTATTTYQVTATNANGCTDTKSITIQVTEDFKITGTNLLTPNGDGYNDYFVLENIDLYPNNQVKIFDKAGRLVYSKVRYDNTWDGTFNGMPLAEGTYYYIVDFGKDKITKKGFISIVRGGK